MPASIYLTGKICGVLYSSIAWITELLINMCVEAAELGNKALGSHSIPKLPASVSLLLQVLSGRGGAMYAINDLQCTCEFSWV